MVPPSEVMVFCVARRSMTGWGVASLNSVLLAPSSPIDIAGKLDHRHLHPEADAEERDFLRTGILDRHDLSFRTALTKPAGDEDPVHILKMPVNTVTFNFFSIDIFHGNTAVVADTAMSQRLRQ